MDGDADLNYNSQQVTLGTQGEPELDYTDYELIKQALMNEKASPELLPYEAELVDRILMQLEHQASYLECSVQSKNRNAALLIK